MLGTLCETDNWTFLESPLTRMGLRESRFDSISKVHRGKHPGKALGNDSREEGLEVRCGLAVRRSPKGCVCIKSHP